MSVQIRPADLKLDRCALIEVIGKNLTRRPDSQRFSWLYCDNPYGTARVWVAVDDKNGGIVGAAAAFPRRMYFGETERQGFVLGDFCMNEGYRSLGPSVQLQRACMEAVTQGSHDFLYDFPSVGMTAVYRRMGIHPKFQMVRWAKPVRLEEKIQRFAGSRLVASGLGPIANFALARRGWKGSADACELELRGGLCDEEFTALDDQLSSSAGIRTARTAAYLNWRYQFASGSRHRLVAARKAGKLVGYVVFTADVQDACIVDLSSNNDPAVVARLLDAAVSHLYKLGATTVSLQAGNTHPWSELFRRAGFRPRESGPVVFYSRVDTQGPQENPHDDWFVMQGERDC